MYNFAMAVPLLMGCGTSKQVGVRAKALACQKVLIVYDMNLKQLGLLDTITNSLDQEGVAWVGFDGVLPDPPDYTVEQAAALAHREQIDGIIGFGGGSAIDTAKAVNVLMNNPAPLKNYYMPGIYKLGVPTIFIPTTAGTGSEVTSMCMITDTDHANVKQSINGAVCCGRLAIIDPELTAGMPPSLTSATGMDAFTHAAESLTSLLANPISDSLAVDAIRTIVEYLPLAYKDGSNMVARENLSYASTMAGIAFTNAIVHIGHAISHALGAAFHIPHGVACAVALPQIIQYLGGVCPDRVKMIGMAAGCNFEANTSSEQIGKMTADKISWLRAEVGIPTLKDLGLTLRQVQEIIPLVRGQICLRFAPKQITDKDIVNLLTDAYNA